MDPDTKRLLDRWIQTFLEPPPLLDAALMRRVLDDHERRQKIAQT